MIALGYIRISSEIQKEGVSLATQREKIEAYCALNDFALKGIVEDTVSAKNLKRPGFQRIMQLAEAREIDAVVCYKLDRCFRNTLDCLQTTKQFDKWGVGFNSITESINTKSPMGKFFFVLLSALAEMERDLISERTIAALEHRKANGFKNGGSYCKFGFDADPDGKLIPNKKEQRIIRRILKLHCQDVNYTEIARRLNKKGYTTKSGKAWSPQTTRSIILSEKEDLKKRVEGLNRAALKEVNHG